VRRLAGASLLASVATVAALTRERAEHRPPPASGPVLRILHLGFEDHLRPGSGGGGLRTHEINRRLAERHHIVVLTTRYPGARRRLDDGVVYRPLGLPFGYIVSAVTYHLAIPLYLLRNGRDYDLIVEDFAAPMSSVLVPIWTSRPCIAVVQWLFAVETSKRYKLPFHVLETLGVRLQRRFVAVSAYMAEQITLLNKMAVIDTVYSGVDGPPPDWTPPPRLPDRLVYLGRLEEIPKGLDLLLEALAMLRTGPSLTIAGDGPGRAGVEERIARMGLAERVTLIGRVGGRDKWDLLASATVVVVPSRYESFGLVALESLAVGTPVVAFAIPSLQEIILPGCGVLVEPFDAGALAGAIQSLLDDPAARASIGAAGLGRSAEFDWDSAAKAQEIAYTAALGGPVGLPDRGRRVVRAVADSSHLRRLLRRGRSGSGRSATYPQPPAHRRKMPGNAEQ
jgi:glycogen synthase